MIAQRRNHFASNKIMESTLIMSLLFVNAMAAIVSSSLTAQSSKSLRQRDIDILRDLMNQETIIRMGMMKDVNSVTKDLIVIMKDMVSVKQLLTETNQELQQNRKTSDLTRDHQQNMNVTVNDISSKLNHVIVNTQSKFLIINSTLQQLRWKLLNVTDEVRMFQNITSSELLNFQNELVGVKTVSGGLTSDLENFRKNVYNLLQNISSSLLELEDNQANTGSALVDLKTFKNDVTNTIAGLKRVNTSQHPNNPDDIVQATCVAIAPNGWAAAVPRDCLSKVPCTTICQRATKKIKRAIGPQGASVAYCFNALHFYNGAITPGNIGKAHMTMYKYGSSGCKSTGCGPNVCCCKV